LLLEKDTRLSCYMYENDLVAGLCSMGVDTLMFEPIPTPAAFLIRTYRADAGIVIAALHNRFYDNGIKFFSAEDFKPLLEWKEKIFPRKLSLKRKNTCG